MRKKQMSLIFLFIFISVLNLSAMETGDHAGIGFFSIGKSRMDIAALNEMLKKANYPEFKNPDVTFGGGGYGFVNKLVIGGSGFGFLKKTMAARSDSFTVSLEGGYGVFQFGYVLFSRKYFKLYPLIGIGGWGMALEVYEKDVSTFEKVLEQPRRGSKLSAGGFLFSLGIGTHYLIPLSEKADSAGGLLVGFFAGYNFSLEQTDWKMNEYDLTGGPFIGFTGPYMQIVIGGGGGLFTDNK